ncbi:type 1 fimbrial protein [Enterobacter ludwigii]|uniref:fimbrial protein n=1 Tax=Enterobacter ludwigii TaxID=299767 RepID=UPI00159C925F|nr:fimbrial protein [Enterobacter ludwigii]QLA06943.1 type 1 fimbrial protein [Enterobacter ludwigii]
MIFISCHKGQEIPLSVSEIESNKMEKASRILVMFLFFVSNCGVAANDLEWTQGKVRVEGSIRNAACGVLTGDKNQAIDLGVTTVGEIINSTRVTSNEFRLHFIDCTIPENRAEDGFFITFDGPVSAGLFDVKGADGVGLQIRDAGGQVIVPGLPSRILISQKEKNTLKYELELVGNGKQMKTGEYYSVLHYRIEYH